MINPDSIQATSRLKFGAQFIRPDYGSYCFAHIPPTILSLFGLPGQGLPQAALPSTAEYEQVVLLLADAFGWQSFERYAADYPFLKEMLSGGVVSRLTSMFPSTTAAHITCLNTGLAVGQSGVYEWFYYEPRLDMVIAPLLFSPAGEKVRELLDKSVARPGDLFPNQTLYQALTQGGVSSVVFMPVEYARSTYSTHVMQGAQVKPYLSWTEALTNLGLLLQNTSGRRYIFVYFSNLDFIGHPYGPGSLQSANETITFLDMMERFLGQLKRSAVSKRTLLLLTADHGLASANPASTIRLNQRFPALERCLRTDRQGRPILFGGSPRDLFLYIQEPRLEEAQDLLTQPLSGLAEVHLTQALIDQGFFGPQPLSPRLLERLGNLVVLPYEGESVIWHVKDKFEQKFFGHHGGLTPAEMLIPFIAYPLAN